ncbi:phosphatase PAP2 family protein [Brachybacterium tyrofermentans]|uniref:phosphatase PAP2 family protein n=1 Tax=Brachybacterium tyrofermentans TaxID=47848 RepID=UPI0018691E84|nr:phosphatase PAP2 family protein [Brachybacterium tyrofermentans]
MALLVAALFLTVVAGYAIRGLPAVGELDRAVVRAASTGLDGAAAGLATGIDLALGPLSAALLMGVMVVVVGVLRRSAWDGLRTGLVVLVPWVAVEGIKLVVRRPRPDADLLIHPLVLSPESFSYPSGHTAVAAALCVGILCSLPGGRGVRGRPGGQDSRDQQGRRNPADRRVDARRTVGIVLAVLVVGATAWSRVALGLHHPTDVLASVLLVPTLGLLLAGLLDPRRSGPASAGPAPARPAPAGPAPAGPAPAGPARAGPASAGPAPAGPAPTLGAPTSQG